MGKNHDLSISLELSMRYNSKFNNKGIEVIVDADEIDYNPFFVMSCYLLNNKNYIGSSNVYNFIRKYYNYIGLELDYIIDEKIESNGHNYNDFIKDFLNLIKIDTIFFTDI